MNIAIILAAGESRRMGEPKQLLPFGSKTMLECVIDAFDSPKIERILVVLGHKADEIGTRISRTRARVVTNQRYREGMFTSVQAALRALPDGTKLVLIALCDQPRLQRATVETLVNKFEKERHKILVPIHGGRQGHPLLFAARYAKEIVAMDSALTLKHFLAAHADDIARVPVADEGVLLDIDDRADYSRELRSVGKKRH
jgi:molybdenum cofactor cytidylyltransferase